MTLLTEEQNMLRDSISKMMDRHATPEYIRRLDKEQAYPYELYDEWVRAGLLRTESGARPSLFVAFDDQKRALHDFMCNTRVIYK